MWNTCLMPSLETPIFIAVHVFRSLRCIYISILETILKDCKGVARARHTMHTFENKNPQKTQVI